MDFATLSTIITVVAAVTFAGIVLWTLSSRQSKRFETASQLPFALPDDAVSPDPAPAGQERNHE